MKSASLCAVALVALGLGVGSVARAELPPPRAGVGPLNLSLMTPGYSYFNRAGADMALHNADVAACMKDAGTVKSLEELTTPPGAMGGISGIIEHGMMNNQHRAVFAAALENCMVVRGWRVVAVTDEEGIKLAALPAGELVAQLAPWVGAAEPHGRVIRSWKNEAARASTIRTSTRADRLDRGQLSLLAATGSDLSSLSSSGFPGYRKIPLDPKWPLGRMKPAEIAATTPAEGGVVIASLAHMSGRNGFGLYLERVGPPGVERPSSMDHAPDIVALSAASLFAKPTGVLVALVVPPGRWRIRGIPGPILELNFCFGAPAFEVKAGEVIYAGAFDLGAEDLGPDMNPAPALAWLAGQPAAAALKPAVWTNGVIGTCTGSALYALEFKDAPFEPGYLWGSRAATPAVSP
ncbi:MAG: hypothetical protein JWP35_1638 [Caulobacter sp.]|nr:hypothetical protein [Caulobacter sp.]